MSVFLKSIPLLMLALVSLVIDDAHLVDTIPALYLAAFIWTLLTTLDKHEGLLAYFRPSTLMCAYVTFFFTMGSFAFSHEWVLDVIDQHEYYHLKHLKRATFFFLCATWVTYLSRCLPMGSAASALTGSLRHATIEQNSHHLVNTYHIWISVCIALLSLVIDIQIPGGFGDFSSCFFMFAVLHLSYVCNVKRLRLRFLVYLAFCGIVAVRFYSDRRLVAFYAFTVCFIELYRHVQVTIRLRSLVVYACGFMAAAVLVIAMSIQRGVGEFDAQSVIESLTYVDDYLQSDWAMTMLFHNFEGPPATFHCYNAANYVMETGDLAYGGTILKALFLPIPRSIFPAKPRSMVDEYTMYFYPVMRADGASFVPNFFVEALWNFGVAGGLLFLFPTFVIFNAIYDRSLRCFGRDPTADTLFLSTYSFLVFFFRGCGLELYVLFFLIFFAISLLYRLTPRERPRVGTGITNLKRISVGQFR